MKLKYQLFITLLVASALLIALMFAVSSWSFSRGFIGYINNTTKARLEPLTAELVALYETSGNWQWTRKKNRRLWHDLLNEHAEDTKRPRSRRNAAENSDLPAQSSAPLKRQGHNSNHRPPQPQLASLLVLTDADKNRIFGRIRKRDRIEWIPLKSNNQTVGYLGFKRTRQLNRQIDKAFEQQQKRSFGYAALGMILLSALLSIPLSSRIVKPLLTVNAAVSEINQGNFDHRITNQRNDEFGDLARNVNNLGFTLEQNLAARQRWIAEISHELRTPLAVLQSEIESMQDGIRETTPESISSLHDEVLRLSRLINDLHQLSLSDIGGLDYQMKPLSLGKAVESFVKSNRVAIDTAHLKLELVTESVAIFGDHQRINQLLDNLLQNSIRYTNDNGCLNVSVTTEGDDAVIHWEDSAPGVDNTDLQHLFDPLYRTDESRNREQAGSGLGLAIVKKIIDGHHGQIEAENGQLGGLHIIVRIPRLEDGHA